MKHLNHYFALFAVCFVAVGAWAQTWTASAPAAGSFYLYNVGNAGFLVGGNNYTSRASLTTQGGIPVTLVETGTAGTYKINTVPTYSSSRFLGSDGYVDNGTAYNWTFTAVEGQANTYTISNPTDGKYLVGHDSETSKTSVTTTAPTTSKGYWKLVSKDDLIANLANATEDAPIDATFAVMNPRFSYNAVTSLWTGDYTAYDGVADNKCVEQFNRTFNMYQTITGLPNGVYKMKCQGYYRMGGGSNDATAAATARTNGTEALNAKYYINTTEASLKSIFDYTLGSSYNTNYNSSTGYTVSGTTVYVPSSLNRASECFRAGEYWNDEIKAVVTDGTVTLGFRKTVTSSNDWAAYDNVILTYYGIDLSALIEGYETLLATAKSLASEPMQASMKTALNTAVTDAETDVNTSSQEWLETTISSLSTAITAAQTSNALYTGAILSAVNGMKAQSTSESVKSALQTKYENCEYESVADVYAAYQPLEIAALPKSTNTSYTSAIINPSFELGNLDSWTVLTNGDDTGVHTTANATYAYSGTDGTYLFNSWAKSVKTLDIAQTITGLPTGYYTLSAVVASFGDGAAVTLIANGISNSISPTDPSNIDGHKTVGYTLTLENILVSDGTLSFKLQNTGKGQTLLKADNFQLTYAGTLTYTNRVYNINVENNEVARYLANTTYNEATATVIGNYATDVSLRNDQPTTVTIPLPEQDDNATLYLALNSSYTDAETFTLTAGTTLYEIKNLLPQQTYYYKVEADEEIIANGTITTTGRLRMIKADGIANMRDLGGWLNADGNRVHYGKLFRGTELRGGNSYTASDADLLMLKNELDIAAEVDLRQNSDFASGTMNSSAIDGAEYYYADLSRCSEDALNQDAAKFKDGFDLILSTLKSGHAAYFHCIYGADRTGCFAFLLEGLLGLPVDQLYKDYELTSFSSAGERDKSGIDHKLQYIKALQGSSLQEKFYNYWRGAVGVSESDLNDFIDIMVDGTSPITTAELDDLPEKAVEDGEYYIYLPTLSKFLGRGENYGTRAVADNYGVPAQITTNGANVTTIQYLDNHLYLGSSGYTDKVASDNTVSWFIEQNGDNFVLKSHNGSYLELYENCRARVDAANAVAATPVSFKNASEQKTIVADTQKANILAAATNVGISAETVSDFKTVVESDYISKTTTVTILSATEGSKTNWPLTEPSEKQNASGNAYNVGNYGGELYMRHGYVSQTVTVPHAGLYKLTLNALYRQGSNSTCYALGQKGYELSNAYVSVNDTYFAQIPSWYSDASSNTNPNNTTQAKTLMDSDKYAIELWAYIGEEKQAEIRVNVPGYTPYGWCIFNNFAMTEYAKNVNLNETDGFTTERDIPNADVTVNKSMTAGAWNTFVVPFDMDIPSGWIVKQPTDFDGSTLTFGDASSIVAGKPYIVKPTEAVTSFSATGVTLKKDLDNTTVGDLTMEGTYTKINAIDYSTQDSYVIGIKNGESALYKVNSTVSLKPFRAYFTVADPLLVKANVIGLNFDYETGITEHSEKTEATEGLFDLSGRRVSKAQKGLYILNGKKVMVK